MQECNINPVTVIFQYFAFIFPLKKAPVVVNERKNQELAAKFTARLLTRRAVLQFI